MLTSLISITAARTVIVGVADKPTAKAVAVAESMARITILDHLVTWRGYDAVQQFEHPWT